MTMRVINSELLPLSRESIAHRIHVHLFPLLQLRGLFIEPLPDGANWLNIIAAISGSGSTAKEAVCTFILLQPRSNVHAC